MNLLTYFRSIAVISSGLLGNSKPKALKNDIGRLNRPERVDDSSVGDVQGTRLGVRNDGGARVGNLVGRIGYGPTSEVNGYV